MIGNGRHKMIMRLVIGIIVVYLLFKLFKGWRALQGPSKPDVPVVGEDLVEDPLCHTYLPVGHAVRAEVDGKIVYFCSRKCLEQYQEKRGK
jgi:YHS domain-containing protein